MSFPGFVIQALEHEGWANPRVLCFMCASRTDALDFMSRVGVGSAELEEMTDMLWASRGRAANQMRQDVNRLATVPSLEVQWRSAVRRA